MAINATNEGKQFEILEAGNYVARCYSMIHLGTIPETINGKVKELNKVRITFELPNEQRVFTEGNGPEPIIISRDFTLSLNEKAHLRAFLENWRGRKFTDEQAKSFDITVLLGLPCLINVIHKPSADGTRIYPEIGAVSTLPKGLECPPAINTIFEFNYENFDPLVFACLPEYIRNKMEKSAEYKKVMEQQNNGEDLTNQLNALAADDKPEGDVPF